MRYYICWLLWLRFNGDEDMQLVHYTTQFICNASNQTINIIISECERSKNDR